MDKPKSESKPKPKPKPNPNPDDLRRMVGYTMITFMGVFLFIPIVWFIHLISQDSGLYVRWGICSAFLVVFNMLFYYWRYPVNWLKNLLVLVGVNLLILIFEYFWLMQSVG